MGRRGGTAPPVLPDFHHRRADGPAAFQRAMGLGGVGEIEDLTGFADDLARLDQVEHLTRHGQHMRAGIGVMDHRRARHPQRSLDRQQRGVDLDRTGGRAVADQCPARRKTVERGHQRVLPDRIVDHRHPLAARDLAHAFGNILATGDDDMGAAIRARDLGFFVGADGADHLDPQGARPLAGDQADATRGRVIQDRLAALQRIDLPEQVLRRHPAHHQRGRRAVTDPIGDRDQHIGRHHPHIRIGALRPQQIAHPVAGPKFGDALAHGLDHADGVGPQTVRQRHRIAPGAEIDVDEIDGNVSMALPHLARTGIAEGGVNKGQDLGAAQFVNSVHP